MGKKYVSMQEELAARKAAAGIDEPARATINKKEPDKEALSAKIKDAFDRRTPREKNRSKIREVAASEDGLLDGEAVSFGEEKKKAMGQVVVVVLALMMGAFALMLFTDDGNDGSDNWDTGEYYGLDDLTADATDEEIMARVDEALENHMAPSEAELNQWLQDKSVSSMIGDDIRFANVTAENKYIVVRAHFDDDDQWELEEMCSEARNRLSDELYDADFDMDPSVLIIARALHGNELLYFSLNDDEYYL